MKQEIENKYVQLDKETSQDISNIMAQNLDQATPFMKLVWDQQQKFFSSQKKKQFATIHDNHIQSFSSCKISLVL